MSKPYIIQSVILVTYDGKKMPLEIINHNIISKPIKVVKEQILDAFSSMVNKPVKVLLKVRYI
mgnify:CR=1 FL=1|jgi:hypothetical protein